MTVAGAEDAAARFGVSAEIHPDDHLWHFLRAHPGFATPEAAIGYYFSDGAASAERVRDLIGPAPELLEFAAGYGCVTRHLARLEALAVTACDIHPQAVAFLHDALGVAAIGSHPVPEMFAPPRPYPAVLALSFFSHMPPATWARWLVRLSLTVEEGGRLVFTTHGAASRVHFGNPEMPEGGFWFRAGSEQRDLPPWQYGQAITSADYVRGVLASLPWMELVNWQEGVWWGHQDCWVLRKRWQSPVARAVVGEP